MKKLFIGFLVLIGAFTLSGCTEKEIECLDTEELIEGVCVEKEPEIEFIDFDEMYPEMGAYYQIFVRSYADSDGDGIGDFNGLTAKLDYMEDLGIEGIWLMPIHPSPTYHGYDVLDYYDINPDYGTLEDFENFLVEAEARGIKVIIDLLVNHTSNQHPWFEAWRNDDPDYQGYYRKITSNDDRYTMNRSLWHTLGGGYYYAGAFGGGMPDLNWSNPAVQQEMLDIALFWMDKGVDGFRLDAAIHLEDYGEVSPPTIPIESSINKLAFFEFNIELEYPDVYIVGEIWDSFNVFSKFVASMDSAMNFETSQEISYSINRGSNGDYVEDMLSMLETLESIDSEAIDAPFLYNHDQDRIASIYGGDVDDLKLAAEMLLTRQGNPFVYYGEELGMFGIKSTGPTIWDETRRQPYLFDDMYKTSWMVDEFNTETDTVDEQLADPNSILNTYMEILNVRKDNLALKFGDTEAWEISSNVLVGYYRTFFYDEDHNQKVLVLHNIGDTGFTYGDIEGEILYYSDGIDLYNGIIDGQSTLIIEVPYEE